MPKQINNYLIIEQIGFGATAKVYKAVHVISRQFAALKCFNKKELTQETYDLIQKEVSIMTAIDYPFIINFQETFEDKNYIYVAMEYAERGNLLDLVNHSIKLSDKSIRTVFTQLALSIDHLHNKMKIAHQDIKAENIMLDKFFNIKLIDFGFAEKFNDEDSALTNYCGSPNYIAPEIVRREKFTCKSDVWSLGVLLYMLMFNMFPYEDDTFESLLKKIANDPIMIPEFKDEYDIKEVLMMTLQKDPTKRASIRKVLNCTYINGNNVMKPYNDMNFNTALFSSGIDSHECQRQTELSKITGNAHDLVISEKLFRRRDILTVVNDLINTDQCIPHSYKSVINRSHFGHNVQSFKKPCRNVIVRPNVKLNTWRKKTETDIVQQKQILNNGFGYMITDE